MPNLKVANIESWQVWNFLNLKCVTAKLNIFVQLQALIAKTKRKQRNARNGKRKGNVAKKRLRKSVKRLATYARSTVISQMSDFKRMKRTWTKQR